jgi:hypothetical protein
LAPTKLYLFSPRSSPNNWGQVNRNLNDFHFGSMGISSTFWILDINDWWGQQAEKHSKYTDLPNVGHHIFSIIPPGVEAEGSISSRQDIVRLRQSKSTCKTLCEKAVVRQLA